MRRSMCLCPAHLGHATNAKELPRLNVQSQAQALATGQAYSM